MVTLTVTDESSVTTFYGVGDAPVQSHAGSVTTFTVSQEGATAIVFWSVDKAPMPNTELARTAYAYIDRSGPSVSANLAEVQAARSPSLAELRLGARDGLSGLMLMTARLDGGEARGSSPSGEIVFGRPSAGSHVLTYEALDMVGNETTGSLWFAVKDTAVVAPAKRVLGGTRKRGVAVFSLVAAVRSLDATLVAATTVTLEQKNSRGVWGRSGTTVVSDMNGTVSKTVKIRKAGTTYWRWRVAATDTIRGAVSATITIKTR